jgi:hypothetical protein
MTKRALLGTHFTSLTVSGKLEIRVIIQRRKTECGVRMAGQLPFVNMLNELRAIGRVHGNPKIV